MKKFLLAVIALWIAAPAYSDSKLQSKQVFTFSPFGEVTLYRGKGQLKDVVIFLSGDGGWNRGMVDIAGKIQEGDMAIVGIDTKKYLGVLNKEKKSCLYPAADLEALSKFTQRKLALRHYIIPTLMGYSSGATLAYGVLAQSPENTFKGAVVMGFCPDLLIKKPLCEGSGKFDMIDHGKWKGYDFGPSSSMPAPFISLQGKKDQICDYASTADFLSKVDQSQLVTLPDVGHGYQTTANWLPEMMDAVHELQKENEPKASRDKEILQSNPDLPLQITPAAVNTGGKSMVLMLSGDGGWTSFDQQLADQFAKKGVPVAGINSLKYFWNAKTPKQTVDDVQQVIEKYLLTWKKTEIILVGYSFGADVMPFVYNELPAVSRKAVTNMVLLSPSKDTDFEIHVSDMLHFKSKSRKYSVYEELQRVNNIKPVCFFGREEKDIPAFLNDKTNFRLVLLNGGHHYEDATGTIVKEALNSQ